MMTIKKNPLVVYYKEKKNDIQIDGVVFYVNGKKRDDFLSDLKDFFKELDGKEREIEIKNALGSWIEKYAKKINDGFKLKSRSLFESLLEKSYHFLINNQIINEEGYFNIFNQKINEDSFRPRSRIKYRELDFKPKYLPISNCREPDSGVTIITIAKTNEALNYKCIRRTRRDLIVGDKELIKKVKSGEFEVEKTNDDERILIDFNTNDPFVKVFIENREIADDLLTKQLNDYEKTIEKLKSLDDVGPFKWIIKTPTEGNFSKKIPFRELVVFQTDEVMRRDQELSKYWEEKFGDTNNVKRLLTFPYKYAYELVKESLEYEGKKFFIKMIHNEFRTLIYGNVNFNDYPNQKITAYHALNIDCDLLNTFNIHIKDLEPQSFQFIEVNYSDDGDIDRINLDGPIDYDFHKMPCEG